MEVLDPIADTILRKYFRSGPGRDTFYLGGGTALALADFRHRRSDDLDFFSRDPNAVLKFSGDVQFWCAAQGFRVEEDLTRRGERFRRFFVEGESGRLHVDLVADSPPFFGPVRVLDGIAFEDRRTLFASKLGALAGRSENRDVVDAYFMFRHSGEDRVGLIRDAVEKEPGLDPLDIAHRLLVFEPDSVHDFLKRYMIRLVSAEELAEFCRTEADLIRGIRW